MSQIPVIEKPGKILISELPDQEKPYETVNGKPYFAIWSIFTVGALITIYGLRYGHSPILGLALSGLALFVQWKAKSYIQFAFYTHYFVIFEAFNDIDCQKINWDDVEEWTIATNHGTDQLLQIRLKSGAGVVQVQLLSAGAVYRAFHKRLPEAETAKKRREEFLKRSSADIFPWKKHKTDSR